MCHTNPLLLTSPESLESWISCNDDEVVGSVSATNLLLLLLLIKICLLLLPEPEVQEVVTAEVDGVSAVVTLTEVHLESTSSPLFLAKEQIPPPPPDDPLELDLEADTDTGGVGIVMRLYPDEP